MLASNDNNRGMTYQTDEKHLTTFKGILCWGGYTGMFCFKHSTITCL